MIQKERLTTEIFQTYVDKYKHSIPLIVHTLSNEYSIQFNLIPLFATKNTSIHQHINNIILK